MISCKQVLTIALAVVLFDLHINITNGIGILLTLIGGVSSRALEDSGLVADVAGMLWLRRVFREEEESCKREWMTLSRSQI